MTRFDPGAELAAVRHRIEWQAERSAARAREGISAPTRRELAAPTQLELAAAARRAARAFQQFTVAIRLRLEADLAARKGQGR